MMEKELSALAVAVQLGQRFLCCSRSFMMLSLDFSSKLMVSFQG